MYKEHKLANGFKIIVAPMPHMTSVSIGLWIGTGGRHESPKQSGISHFIEHMLFKGTFDRTAKDLKESIEGIGGSLNGFTSDEVTCYMCKVPAKYFGRGMGVITDMVLNPKFDETDILKEKYVVCEEIKMYKDQPSERVHEILEELMWPGDPLGRPLTGTISTVKSFKRGDLCKYKDRNYHPSNMSLVVTGKVTLAQVMKCVSEYKERGKNKKNTFKKPEVLKGEPRIRIFKGNTQQAYIALGFPVENSSMKDRFALKITNVVLGGNMSSRLFEELREKQGLCYDVGSNYKRHKDIGEFVVHAGVDNSKAIRSTLAILKEIRNLRDNGVGEEELLRAKEFAKGQFTLGLESTSSCMLWLGDRMMVDGKIPDIKEVMKRVDAVDAKDIRKVCGDIFRSDLARLAVIGKIAPKDRNLIRKEIARL